MSPAADSEIWNRIRAEARGDVASEPALERFLTAAILDRTRLSDALAHVLASKLATVTVDAAALKGLFAGAHHDAPSLGLAAVADLQAVVARDPACRGYSVPLLYFKGFHAIQAYRIAHHLWTRGRSALALYLQSRVAEVLGVDIHPGARLGQGLLLDHATGLVIGETAVVADDVSMLHEVTLGGTGKTTGDRHPKVRRGVLIGAGAKILGNIVIGEGAKVGAGSVVLHDVPAHTTVAGVPARPVGRPKQRVPALEMDQSIEEDTGTQRVRTLRAE